MKNLSLPVVLREIGGYSCSQALASAESGSQLLQSDLLAALTAYIGSTPVSITYAPASAPAGVAFNTSVQFPPNNQISAQVSAPQAAYSIACPAMLLQMVLRKVHGLLGWLALCIKSP